MKFHSQAQGGVALSREEDWRSELIFRQGVSCLNRVHDRQKNEKIEIVSERERKRKGKGEEKERACEGVGGGRVGGRWREGEEREEEEQ